MKVPTFYATLLIFCFSGNVVSQAGHQADSLQRELLGATTDLKRAQLHSALAKALVYRDLVQARKHVDTLAAISESMGDETLQREALYNYAVIHRLQGDYHKALELQQEYADHIEQTTDTTAIAKAHYQLGASYLRLDNYDTASIHLLKGLSYAEQIGDYALAFKILNALGILYKNLYQHEESLQYYQRAIEYCLLLGDTASLPIIYNGIGVLYQKMDSSAAALPYFKKGLAIAEKVGNVAAVASQSRNLGVIHFQNGDYDLAEQYHTRALEIRQQLGVRLHIAGSHNDLGEVYLAEGLIAKAESHFLEALEIFTDIDALISQNHIYLQLSRTSEQKGDYREANRYLTQFYSIRDSLKDNELRTKVNELDLKYQTAQKDQELAGQRLQITRTRSQRNLLLAGVALLLLFTWFLIYRNRKNKLLAQSKIDGLQKQQRLAALDYVIQGQEEERSRMANDLHDSLGGLLTSVRHKMLALPQQVVSLSEVDLYRQTSQLVSYACDEVRRISHDMMPASLVSLGLADAIEDLSNEIESSHDLTVTFHASGALDHLPARVNVSIYRIIQEIGTNCIKHAQAKEMRIELKQEGDQRLELRIADDGNGFDWEAARKQGGLGLKSIESRVKYLDGDLKVKSAKGAGTEFLIQVPLREAS